MDASDAMAVAPPLWGNAVGEEPEQPMEVQFAEVLTRLMQNEISPQEAVDEIYQICHFQVALLRCAPTHHRLLRAPHTLQQRAQGAGASDFCVRYKSPLQLQLMQPVQQTEHPPIRTEPADRWIGRFPAPAGSRRDRRCAARPRGSCTCRTWGRR
jgi:hypothetical protein